MLLRLQPCARPGATRSPAPELACRGCAGGSYSLSRQPSRRPSQLQPHRARVAPSASPPGGSTAFRSCVCPRGPRSLGVAPASQPPWIASLTRDLSSPRQVHVTYAIPADGVDQFAAFGSRLATDAEAMDVWWRREDPTRTLRFDLFAFPGCTAKFGRLDIGFVRLPRSGGSYLGDIGCRPADRRPRPARQPHEPQAPRLLRRSPRIRRQRLWHGIRTEVGDNERRAGGDRVRLDEVAVRWRHRRGRPERGRSRARAHSRSRCTARRECAERMPASRRRPRLRLDDRRAVPVSEQPDDDLRPDA